MENCVFSSNGSIKSGLTIEPFGVSPKKAKYNEKQAPEFVSKEDARLLVDKRFSEVMAEEGLQEGDIVLLGHVSNCESYRSLECLPEDRSLRIIKSSKEAAVAITSPRAVRPVGSLRPLIFRDCETAIVFEGKLRTLLRGDMRFIHSIVDHVLASVACIKGYECDIYTRVAEGFLRNSHGYRVKHAFWGVEVISKSGEQRYLLCSLDSGYIFDLSAKEVKDFIWYNKPEYIKSTFSRYYGNQSNEDFVIPVSDSEFNKGMRINKVLLVFNEAE